MSTEIKKTEIANQFLTGLRTRDWDLLKSIMAEDAVWNLPGSSLISGEAQGADAIVRRAQLIVSYGLTFTLKHILIGQNGVALSLNNTARRGDLVLDAHLATVMSIRDGKISAIDTYFADVDMVNAFFVPK
jgi:ketosteroid isomerase-like protein